MATDWTPNRYPPARKSDHVDVYKSKAKGEVKVADPYNWMESKNEELDGWIASQEKLTGDYLAQFKDRTRLKDEMMKNADFAKFSAPTLKGDKRWYWYYNSGLQAQSVIYRSETDVLPNFSQKDDGPGGEVFFDPNLLSEDGTAAVSATAFSKCGKYFAYGVSLSGSDFFTIYVRPSSSPFAMKGDQRPTLEEGRLAEEIRYVKFSGITWTHDSKGFFYQRYAAREKHGGATEDKAGTETDEDRNAMLYYHRVGTPQCISRLFICSFPGLTRLQAEDILVMQDPAHPTWMWGTEVSEVDGKYLLLYISRDTARKNQLWITDLTKNEIGSDMVWNKVIDTYEDAYDVIANDGTKLYIKTNKDAPQYRVMTLDFEDKERKLTELIPEDPSALLEDIQAVGDNFVIVYSRNVISELYVYTKGGEKLHRLAPEFIGSIDVSSKRDQSWFFATQTGFTTPGIVSRYDFNAPQDQRWGQYRVTKVKGLNPADFFAEQVWYTSKDGTKVPMFLVHHKEYVRDGNAPAIQYGYGGFSYSVSPFFSTSLLTYIKAYRGILAVANIRGGAEFGETWHQAGTKENKVNVFDDFIAATNFLVEQKYAARKKVAINGASNGGLLVAACLNRAPPQTFGAAVAEVGVHDMLKFSLFTIGKAWESDYGSPQDPNDFDFIHPYSPLHNVPQHEFPPTILLTADHDDRVVPLHSFKLAATLQEKLANNPHPLLIRIDTKSGHGAGKSTEKKIIEAADKWGFVAQSLGLTWHDD